MVLFDKPYMRFPISLPLQLCVSLAPIPTSCISKNLKGHVILNTSLSGVVYHACTSIQSVSISTRHLKCPASQIPNI